MRLHDGIVFRQHFCSIQPTHSLHSHFGVTNCFFPITHFISLFIALELNDYHMICVQHLKCLIGFSLENVRTNGTDIEAYGIHWCWCFARKQKYIRFGETISKNKTTTTKKLKLITSINFPLSHWGMSVPTADRCELKSAERPNGFAREMAASNGVGVRVYINVLCNFLIWPAVMRVSLMHSRQIVANSIHKRFRANDAHCTHMIMIMIMPMYGLNLST